MKRFKITYMFMDFGITAVSAMNAEDAKRQFLEVLPQARIISITEVQ